MVPDMDQVFRFGLMVRNMRENGVSIKQTAKENFGMLTVIFMKDTSNT